MIASVFTFGSTNIWNPIGWTILGVMAGATVVMVGVMVYDAVKSYSMNVPDPYARPGQKNRVESLKIKVARKKDINREIIKETVNLLNQKNIRHPVRDIKNTNEVNSNDTYLDNRKMD